ncbi:synaptotagmin-like protein 3 [Saccopteryx leptura]|uniref:synaptotagmin-like protein 3 n=1 Tax=Saccopteryx leptura TaxID=249018 RepID=UPI00339BA11C
MAQEVNLNSLQDLEREAILQVLYRDRAVQHVEEERIRKLKTRLQHLRWKGARSAGQQYGEKACARCRRGLGLLLNRGAVCQGCSHCVCSECRVRLGTHVWRCTVCYEGRNVRIKTGEWFFAERAKKFPTEGRHETAGAKLLQSYQKLSSRISVVPPTPPPLSESWCSHSPGRLQELGQSKGFNKSVENLFLSVTTHMKKLSKSQNDMTADKQLCSTGPRQRVSRTERRSQSDTAINVATRKVSAPDILKTLNQESPKRPTNPVLKQEDLLSCPMPGTLFSGGTRQWCSLQKMAHFPSNTLSIANILDSSPYLLAAPNLPPHLWSCPHRNPCDTLTAPCGALQHGVTWELVRKQALRPRPGPAGAEPAITFRRMMAKDGVNRSRVPAYRSLYVKTYLLPDSSSQGKRKTAVQRNTVDPTFQETLKYQVEPAQLVTRRLQVSVWHMGSLARRVFLGEVIIPLATWDFEDSATQSFCWHPLRAKAEKLEDSIPQNQGELAVRAKLVLSAGPGKLQEAQEGTERPSSDGQLCLVVLGAKNLPVRPGGTLNSFVKGCLTLPDRQTLRLKSPVLKKQVCPQWKHSFVFNGVSPSQLRQSSLALSVWDQAVFGVKDRLLGEAWLGPKDDPAGGADSGSQSTLQWQKVLSSPNTWTDLTLILH